MPFIEILLPTGHREKVEINATASLITVLEDVCIKRGLIADNCYLTYNKTKVDLSQKFGISRILNNAKLDLVESPTSLIENSSVDVVLQLPSSSRINASFCPKDSLFNIMESFAKTHSELKSDIFPENNELTPVIINVHDQIIGEFCLKNTTLASLGLRMGKILFRLEFREITVKDMFLFEENTRLRMEKCRLAVISRQNKEKVQLAETAVTTVNRTVPAQQYRMINSTPDADTMDPTVCNDFTPFSAFSSTNKSMFDDHTHASKTATHQKEPQTLGELLGINLDQDFHAGNYEAQNTQDFLNFKFPEVQISQEIAVEDGTHHDKVIVSMEARESVLYQHKPAAYNPSNEDVPENFFDLTEQDLRSIIQSYRSIAESDTPLMTTALREQMREKKFAKYQRCIIQFHFPDAYILQSVFQPRETVGDMHNYIAQFFRNDSSNFYLYTSPPKDVLKSKDKTLIQSDLVPMSKVYVSVSAKDLSMNVDQLLSGDEVVARQVIEKWMKNGSNGPNPELLTPGPGSADRHVKSGSSGNAHKMPKWFKSGK